VKLTFTVDAGWFLRSAVRRSIRGAGHRNGLTVTIEEERGPFESTLLVTAVGDEPEMIRFMKAVRGLTSVEVET